MNSKATVFEFTSYKFNPDKRRAVFNYKIRFNAGKSLIFSETIIFPKAISLKNIQLGLVKKLLEGVHLMLAISYYKIYCPAKIKLKYKLSKKEADFWNTVYKKGLGEFFYKNKLDPKISPNFPYIKNYNPKPIPHTLNPKSLVGIGGGKDSIVTIELLKKNDFNIDTIFIETNGGSELIDKIIKTAGVKNLNIKRILDKKVFEKHLPAPRTWQADQYSGHIPISAIYAFLGIFTSVLYGYKYFIVGNEYSSNFGNIKYKGIEVNHQWSKSLEFEKLFQNYLKGISPDIGYFSILRPFYEIRIAKLFSQLGKKYFKYFSSCNRNYSLIRTNKRIVSGKLWCLECPKCVFVFILLSAFLSKKELLKIFGKNLYVDKKLLPLFKDVLGLGNMKPFDCVGTFEESQSAFFTAKNKFKNSFIIKVLSKKVKFYPETFKAQKEFNIPEQFGFLGIENVLILGYGKEGRVTEKYLRKYYPKIKISIADKRHGNSYLKNQEKFDMAIKTPGIKKELVKIPYTTATNIFFSCLRQDFGRQAKVKGRNLIIGVTGSKGKSTTASLIFEILKAEGKDVELLGNIGKPMLERLLIPIPRSKIFVLELSSYQLDDIRFSPDIAVVTNLFPEHMDYHGGLQNYYNAKKNIINFQNENNYFFYNAKNKIIKNWLNDYRGKTIPFSKSNLKSNLVGEHNQENIAAAVAVAKTLKVQDKAIKRAVANFNGLPHRLEFVGQFNGIKFYDDAISTTPNSTIMAIKALKNINTILLGGQDRGYDFSDLEKTLIKYKIKNIVLFPDSGNKILKSKRGFNVLNTSNMKEAVKFAYKMTERGKICLLSSASPSYSLWNNFEEKGNQFKEMVRRFNQ